MVGEAVRDGRAQLLMRSPLRNRRMRPTPAASSARSPAARQPAVDLPARKSRNRSRGSMSGVRDATRASTAAPADFAPSRSKDCGRRSIVVLSSAISQSDCFGRRARVVGQRDELVREALERSARRLWRCIRGNRARAVGQQQRGRVSKSLRWNEHASARVLDRGLPG